MNTPTQDGEQWRPVPKYPDCDASNLGRIRSRRVDPAGRVRAFVVGRDGYCRIIMCAASKIHKTEYLHRLVASAWLENPDQLPDINHKNHDKRDNRPENLEWCTHRENLEKARAHLGNWARKGGESPTARALIAHPIGGGEPVRWACARDFMRSAGGKPGWCGNISRAARSGRPAYGFRWSFADRLQNKAQ